MRAGKLLAEWFWTDRWMGSSAFLLPMEARGLYREMLTQAWRRGARLPADPETIRRAVACTEEEWTRCWPLIARYWQLDGTDLVNDTQRLVYQQARDGAIAASERAKNAADARWNAQADAQAMLERCPPSPSPSPSLISKEQDQEQSPPKARRPVENPKAVEKPKLAVLIKLVHAVLDDHPAFAAPGQLAELAAETKQRAADAKLAYTALAIAAAIDQALAQREAVSR